MKKTPRQFTDEFNRQTPPPKAVRVDETMILHDTEVKVPYRLLEELEADLTTEWVEQQNRRTQAFLEGVEDIPTLGEHLDDIWEYEQESLPTRRGNRSFTYYNDGKSAQRVYRVREGADAEPKTIIDPNELDPSGNTSLTAAVPSPDGKYVAFTLSEGGRDAQTIRVLDVEKGELLEEDIPCRTSANIRWDQKGEGFSYSMVDRRDHDRYTIYHHTLGEAIEKDTVEFDLHVPGSLLVEHVVHDEQGKRSSRDYISVKRGTHTDNGLYIRERGSDDAFDELFNDGIHHFDPIMEKDGLLYMRTNHDAPMGKVVAVDLADPAPGNWKTIIPEQGKDLLLNAFPRQGKLFVNYMHDTATKLRVHDFDGTHLHDAPLPPQVTASFGGAGRNKNELMMSVGGFKSMPDQYAYDTEKNELNLHRQSAARFDLKDAIVERVHATSKDGTKVPMTIIRGKDTKLDGSAATLMYGYGGFNIPLQPTFNQDIYNWVKEGGIYVQTNLRGGGEFGKEWNDGGKLGNKQNVFDDFAACGEYLIEHGYTKPERLAVKGESNGGLLTLATSLQRPELFGAVISGVPVADMLRFNAWPSDYGRPMHDKHDFEACMRYSPVHNVRKGGKYPPMLVETAEFDDRVHPSHAYKFVATMQHDAPDSLCLLHVERNSGHGAGKSKEKSIDGILRQHGFLEQALGPINQEKYKAAMAELDAGQSTEAPSSKSWAEAVRSGSAAREHARINRAVGSAAASR